jgi:hypothetical protein
MFIIISCGYTLQFLMFEKLANGTYDNRYNYQPNSEAIPAEGKLEQGDIKCLWTST